jgi:hypothetical protein
MKIAQTYSHLNGLEYLLVHHRKLWNEIRHVVSTINAAQHKTKVSKEARMKGQLKYSPKHLNVEFCEQLNKLGWEESRVSYWVTSDHKLIRQTLSLEPAE